MEEIPKSKKTNENERQIVFNCVFPFGVFSCLFDVFSICCVLTRVSFRCVFTCGCFATGVIKDPVEFAIFAYVDTWGGVGDVTVLATCTHGRCSATHGAGGGGDVTVLATCTHGRCSATLGAGGVMLPFWQLAHMVGVLATCTHGRCSGNLHTWSVFRNTWCGGG